ncbi:MAG TPA: aldo/keto reductase [Candidatus Hydrogenedentes bacterium]|nr:aldo/keto reductase [Candidatus Hydrogenedentota bacterium]
MSTRLDSKPMVAGIDKPISELALGTAFYSYGAREKWFPILDDFYQAGGTLLDSGRIYGDSEKVLGEWMASRGNRENLVVITKGGHGPDGSLPAENLEGIIASELETSLTNLRTDYVDLYMLHRDNPAVPVGVVMDLLNREIASGRARALGASNWEYDRVVEANAYAEQHGFVGFAVVSNNLSLAVPAAPFYPGLISTDEAGERWHCETGIPLVSWSSQARGFFTGRYTPELRDSADRVEDGFTKRMIEVYCTDANFERLRRAEELGAKKGGYSAVEVALAWLRHKPFSLIPIVGPHTPDELASCIRATALELTNADSRWLNLEA